MKLSQFIESLDTHEFDPRPRFKLALERAIARESAHLPDAERDQLLVGLLPALLADAKTALDRGAGFEQLCGLLAEFVRNFRAKATQALVKLRPKTPLEEIAAFTTALSRNGWTGFEISLLADWLAEQPQPEQVIRSVTPRAVTTGASRSVTRDDLRERRPKHNWTNVLTWEAQFASESSIRAIEAEASDRLQADKYPHAGSRNFDLPDPRR